MVCFLSIPQRFSKILPGDTFQLTNPRISTKNQSQPQIIHPDFHQKLVNSPVINWGFSFLGEYDPIYLKNIEKT